jgi:transcriptional regulator with XRE-family HTH domain
MTQDNKTDRTIHQGRNIKRFREMLGMKQETLATMLHEDWTQVNVSRIEQKETIDTPLLKQISAALKIPVEAIENFDEEQAINVISNTINNNDNATMTNPAVFNFQPSFNPIDKLIELYERMLQQQREMIEKLERLIEKK